MATAILPMPLAEQLLEWHRTGVYNPLSDALEHFASRTAIPSFVTPNVISVVSGLSFIPIVMLMRLDHPAAFELACVLAILHDVLDRLDGALARANARRGLDGGHDSNFGAFLDAQMDKVYHISMLIAFIRSPYSSLVLGWLWLLVAVPMIAIQAVMFVVRIQDYRAPPSALPRGIKARGEGKLATFACNFAAVLTLHAFAMYTMEAYWLAFTVGLVATILLFIGADMAIRSLRLKLMARANSR